MENNGLQHLYPTMGMIAQHLRDAGWDCHLRIRDEAALFHGIQIYDPRNAPRGDVVYLLDTPVANPDFACVSTVEQPGCPNCVICPGRSGAELLNRVLEVFARCREWECRIDQAVYSNVSLSELCELGAQLLGNPVGIHDDWFFVIAMSRDFSQVIEQEFLPSSPYGFIPRSVVEDFQHDSDYLETYTYRNAQVWNPENGTQPSLYVNLWEGAIYMGRLLVIENGRKFRPADYQLAEILTQRAMRLMVQQKLDDPRQVRGMDNIILDLLHGKRQDTEDVARLLNTLHWEQGDRYACVQVRGQQALTSLQEHNLHSEMFRIFPDSYILLSSGQQILILNLTRSKASLGDTGYQLAPLCRDYYLYVSISSGVSGIQALAYAYCQAELAMRYAFAVKSEKWIVSFSDCALAHIMETLASPLPPQYLTAPCLQELIDHDREKGTQYFQTFRTYMLMERDIPRTAEALIIHRTTLIYRLKKIQSLTGVDLEREDVRLYILLSLYILEHDRGADGRGGTRDAAASTVSPA